MHINNYVIIRSIVVNSVDGEVGHTVVESGLYNTTNEFVYVHVPVLTGITIGLGSDTNVYLMMHLL